MEKKDYLNLDGLRRFHAKIQEKITAVSGSIASHTGNKSNPHGVTKSQVGLGSVPNVATNDQTPTYSQASSLANIVSGEKLAVSLGKVMKAIADFIVHKADAAIHITAAERTKWNAVTNKVDKVSGKGLSTNDYTTAEKTKLSGIAAGAEVNVQADWNVTDTGADAYIKNRPAAFPPSSHTHDDRYYTESEMNTKLGTKVDASGGDIAATKVGSFTASTASYPVPAANDTVKVGFGKIKKFFEDIRNATTGACFIGQIVNNCVTNNASLPLSAAQGKVLMDLYTKLNSDLGTVNSKMANTIPSVAHLGLTDASFTAANVYINSKAGHIAFLIATYNMFVYVGAATDTIKTTLEQIPYTVMAGNDRINRLYAIKETDGNYRFKVVFSITPLVGSFFVLDSQGAVSITNVTYGN